MDSSSATVHFFYRIHSCNLINVVSANKKRTLEMFSFYLGEILDFNSLIPARKINSWRYFGISIILKESNIV